MMRGMATKWARLGEKLKDARVALNIEQQQIAGAIGVGRGAIRNIERGDITKITPTIRQYAQIVGWSEGDAERVLAGGEPVQGAPVAAPASAGLDLAVDVQESLRRGPLLKSQVVEVKTPSGTVRATIVLRGEDGSSAEDLLAALRAVNVNVSTDASATPLKE